MIISPHIPLFDSNVIINYFLQNESAKVVENILKEHGCYIVQAVLCETLNFLHNRQSAYFSLSAAKAIIGMPKLFQILEITSSDLTQALDIMSQYQDSKLTYTDSLLLWQAQKHNLVLYTSDQRMHLYPGVRIVNPF